MRCPICENEMQDGATTLSTMQGLGAMLLSFCSEENREKSIFKRKTADKIVLFGDELSGWLCPRCKKVFTVFELD